MSSVLLIELYDRAMLYRTVPALSKDKFSAWRDGGETKLYWRGRQVRRVFSMGCSSDCWRSIPLEGPSGAIAGLRMDGWCRNVRKKPTPEGELPS